MAQPSVTSNTTGNIVNAAALAGSATSSAYEIDNHQKFGAVVLLTVAWNATLDPVQGVRIDLFPNLAGAATTRAVASFYVGVAGTGLHNTTTSHFITKLDEGIWWMQATNLDGNPLGSFSLTTNTTDAVA